MVICFNSISTFVVYSLPNSLCLCVYINIWWESWRTDETCCHSDSNERPPTDSGVKKKKLTRIKIMINIKFELICESMHYKIFTFLSLYQQQSLYIYIYIYIYTKPGQTRIINLFPSCYGYWYESITPK